MQTLTHLCFTQEDESAIFNQARRCLKIAEKHDTDAHNIEREMGLSGIYAEPAMAIWSDGQTVVLSAVSAALECLALSPDSAPRLIKAHPALENQLAAIEPQLAEDRDIYGEDESDFDADSFTPAELATMHADMEKWQRAESRRWDADAADARRGMRENIIAEYGTPENYYHAVGSAGDEDEIARIFNLGGAFMEPKNCRKRAKGRTEKGARETLTHRAKAFAAPAPAPKTVPAPIPVAELETPKPLGDGRFIAAPELLETIVNCMDSESDELHVLVPVPAHGELVAVWFDGVPVTPAMPFHVATELQHAARAKFNERRDTPAPATVLLKWHPKMEARSSRETDARETVRELYAAAIAAHPQRTAKLEKSRDFQLREYGPTLEYLAGKGKPPRESVALWEKRARAALEAKIA